MPTPKSHLNLECLIVTCKISDDEMMEMLKTADLKSHGYEKEIISQLVSSDTKNAKSVYEKRFQFLKTIECSRMREIDQELNRLTPGRIFWSKFRHAHYCCLSEEGRGGGWGGLGVDVLGDVVLVPLVTVTTESFTLMISSRRFGEIGLIFDTPSVALLTTNPL